MRATTTVQSEGELSDEDRYATLAKESNVLEQRFLNLLKQHGYRPPDEAQKIVDGYYVRPDFAYHSSENNVAVFLDGPIHDGEYQKQKDEDAGARLEDEAGWTVLRFPYSESDDAWLVKIGANRDIFGPGKAGR